MKPDALLAARSFTVRAVPPLAGVLLMGMVVAPAVQAQAVYRCPGNHYTNDAREAQQMGCKTIEGLPVTVVAPPRPRAAAAAPAAPGARPATAAATAAPTPPASSTASGTVAAPPSGGRVEASAQRQRDADARRILGEELAREEARLAELQREYAGGQPERRGDERNYQKYLDRVAGMQAAIARSQADVMALRRELAKLPPVAP